MGTLYKFSQKHYDHFKVVPQKIDKIALVTEGGGQRGIFTAGVLDAFIQADFNPFDLLIGTSAGSLNLASYICGHQGHAYKIIAEATRQPEFFKLAKYLLSGQGLDLEWLVDKADNKIPLNWVHGAEQLKSKDVVAVATNSKDLRTEYFDLSLANWKGPLKASCAIPAFHRAPIIFNNTRWLDGGVSAPIPVEEAYRRGYRHIVVIRTLPVDLDEHHPWIESLMKHTPNKKVMELSAILHKHEESYRKTEAFLNSPPEDLNIFELFPSQHLNSSAMGSSKKQLDADYHQGINLGKLFVETMAKKFNINFTEFTKFDIRSTESDMHHHNGFNLSWENRDIGLITGKGEVNLHWLNVNPNMKKDTLVVIQGRNESSWKYREVIEELSQHFNVFTYDHRGQGESGRTTDLKELGHVDYFHDYVEDLAHFMDQVVKPKVQGRCFMLAHSMGATVATHYLSTYKHSIDACVMTSPMFAIKLPKVVGNIQKTTIKVINKLQKKPNFAPTQHAFMKKAFTDNDHTTSRIRFENYSQMLDKLPRLRLGGASPKWIVESMLAGESCLLDAPKINCPILIIQAGSDNVVCNKSQEIFNEKCTVSRILSIKNAKHDILIEADRYRDKALKSAFNFLMHGHQYH